jgi:hypothetical protein
MSTLRFSRLHFFKKFNPQAEYIVLKDMVLGGVEIKRGDMLDKSLLPMHKIKRLFETRKITPEYSLYENDVTDQEKDLTNAPISGIVSPEIVKAGPRWKKVMLGNEQIGKTVGSDEEAQAIIAEWLENQNK